MNDYRTPSPELPALFPHASSNVPRTSPCNLLCRLLKRTLAWHYARIERKLGGIVGDRYGQ